MHIIIAHTNWKQLQLLVSLLDDEQNDIYIHIDKKIDITDLHLQTKVSSLFFVPRIDVRWGTISLIEAEFALFEKASKGKYFYYHLISGFDLPLHNQKYIHNFFNLYSGKEFIGFGKKKWDIYQRVYCHNVFGRQMRNKYLAIRYFLKIIRLSLNKLQILLHCYPYRKPNILYKYGCEWVSITHDFVIDLIRQKDKIFKQYKYAYCPDEIYKQTFAFNSPKYRDRIYDMNDEFKGCMREIDWNRGRPYTYTINDYDMLIHSNKLFARKFDERKDMQIITKIVNYI